MPKEKPILNIGEVIRTYRSQRSLSQGDIERRTGLLRCYLSRVENGHTVPSLETLAKCPWPRQSSPAFQEMALCARSPHATGSSAAAPYDVRCRLATTRAGLDTS